MDQRYFAITCPFCSQDLRCSARAVGFKKRCPNCQEAFFVSVPVAVPLENQQDLTEIRSDFALNFSESENAIDDSVIRLAAVCADKTECGMRPQFVYRTTVRKCSVIQDVFVSFPKKVLSIRDELAPVRIRLDRDEPFKMSISTSEAGDACFIQEVHTLLNRMQEAKSLLIELRLMRQGTQVFEFNILDFRDIYPRMFAGAIGANLSQLQRFNQELVDHVFRLGPRNTEALIEVLRKSNLLHHDQIDKARSKEIGLFEAVQYFGEKYHVGEIYGYVEGNKLNDSLTIAVYNNLSDTTRRVIENLVISE